ncbi:2Fe-2S iron-sulfur cluster-binding protein [soil metagenome]
MPRITYVLPDGSQRIVDIAVGESVMEGSVRNNLPGIVAECGGGCSCATCHVYLDPGLTGAFEGAVGEERDLIEFVAGRADTSRLSCQLIVTDAADGARVIIPSTN